MLIVVLVAADFGAKAFAENAIATKIDSSGLGTKPSVDIEGFPFLTQVASRDLSQIDINASNFTVKQVVISSLHATATGVRPNASFNGATISKINGTVVVSFATVTNLIPIPGLTVSADPADGPDAIKFNSSLGGATGKIEQISPNVIKVRGRQPDRPGGPGIAHRRVDDRLVVHLRHTDAAGRPGRPLHHRHQPGHRRHRLGAEHHAVPVVSSDTSPRASSKEYAAKNSVALGAQCPRRPVINLVNMT